MPVCRSDTRRGRIRSAALGGVDGVEVGDDGRTLTVTFLGKAPHGVGPGNVRIDGGRRITGLTAESVTVEREEDPGLDDRMTVVLDRTGDRSSYLLSLVAEGPGGRPGSEPYPGFDQRYFSAAFRFGADCPSPFDCADGCGCGCGCGGGGGCAESAAGATGAGAGTGTHGAPAPVIDYTARDFDTLRQVVLDRLALTAPDWRERHAADLGTTLVELLAHTADRIGYEQDAVATEAYLDTARRRVSVRRHVRLIDYPMHDGCNARTFVTLEVAEPLVLPPYGYRFAAIDVRTPGLHEPPAPGTVLDEEELAALDERGAAEVFEPLGDRSLHLHPAHNAIRLWTWGDEQCFLPEGATSATLRDEWADDERTCRTLRLRPGDLLILEEVLGPRTGTPGDADPAHRQPVRLTSVTEGIDELEDRPVLEVTWAPEDAPDFPLVLSTVAGPDCEPVADVTVARGNTVLVDHGRSLTWAGAEPEWTVLPGEPAVTASCEPQPGCADRRSGNPPARLVGSLLREADHGRQLAPDSVRELHRLFGADATARAGIGLESAGLRGAGAPPAGGGERVFPATVHGQAAALRTLLAQSVYPGIAPRPRPVLENPPPSSGRGYPHVVQAVPYPEPRHVAGGQARRLAAVPEAVRQRLTALWRSARDRDGLSDDEVAELTVLFGLDVLERLALEERPAAALRELLARSDHYLVGKLRRLEVLTARARAGTVLDGRIAWEIAQTWGRAYAAGLHPDDPVLHGPASASVQDPRSALPAVVAVVAVGHEGAGDDRNDRGDRDEDGEGGGGGGLGGGRDGFQVWRPRRDLLESGPYDRHFTGELEDDGRLALRFGDGLYGAVPEPGSRLALHYRVGGGPAGNVGAEAIGHLVLGRDPDVVDAAEAQPVAGVRNPLPATGGTAPEPVDQVRQLAPLSLKRERLRAVTAEDYAHLAAQVPGVQRAAAEIRWTGSVSEAHVAVDGCGSAEPAAGLLAAVEQALEGFRRIGHDLVVRPAQSVPLDIAVTVCAAPGHQHGQILDELYRVLGPRRLPGGRGLGFFHPDALTFGEPVRLSRLVAAGAAVAGVESLQVTRLRRQFHEVPLASRGGAPRGELEDGVLRLGPLEIAQCDNDPVLPENGRLEITLAGGGTPGDAWGSDAR
ncbi:putative baseplate assembly protein [Streptomyces sp. HNM0575]|uniref:putative baseplate assembly protein n=1 Tax=Streptomyces sp. HNM0575 TaxID=2716338 RepID=UPI00145EE353|nr:putative baseplate assembly protein [Streptomyces sp. HNM0575]NLU71900.1 putative baseplate assembly protein [Streptomyces sp. HNM0575]